MKLVDEVLNRFTGQNRWSVFFHAVPLISPAAGCVAAAAAADQIRQLPLLLRPIFPAAAPAVLGSRCC